MKIYRKRTVDLNLEMHHSEIIYLLEKALTTHAQVPEHWYISNDYWIDDTFYKYKEATSEQIKMSQAIATIRNYLNRYSIKDIAI